MQAPDGVPIPQRYWAVLTISLGLVMAVLDGAIANVALPTIARDLHTTPAESIWVVNAYQLAVTISLLPLSSLGEIVGYRRIFIVGMVAFTIASLGCALSSTLLTLTIARVFQGFGAAGIMSVNTALIRFIYPRTSLGKGIGINAMVGSASTALGPTVASAILSVAHWPWLFAVNVPTGILAVAAGLRALPRTPTADRPFDLPSAVMSALTFGLLITSIDGLGHGQSLISIALALIAAVGIGAVLVGRQMAETSPLVPVDLLRIPVFALSVLTSVCSFTAQGLAYVSLPFFFQNVLGRSQVETGLLMTPWPVTVVLVSSLAGKLSDRYPAGLLGGIGLAFMSLGLASLAMLPADPSVLNVVWRMSICGLGFGLFNPPNNRQMLMAAPPARSGGASGMLATARLFGQTSGAALVAMAFGFFPTHGTTVTLAMGAGFAGCAAVISVLRLRERA